MLKITPQGWQVLKSQAEARLTQPAGRKRRPRGRTAAAGSDFGPDLPVPAGPKHIDAPPEAAAQPLDPAARALYDRLRLLRREIAEAENVPAFMVFSDKVLREIARARPASELQLRSVKGVGPAKCEAYGGQVLNVIRGSVAD
ncbi:MAG: HRDC domain-containing protein [Planctomycetes bacterium]|nr:HRDC domain-containing protein [Planctomycetota bacterium]